jgi:polyhydroxyalkanoate synthesis regulator phasin
MSEDQDNMVLRLLREIRAQQIEDSRRLVRVERRLDELHESNATALGLAAHANVVVEQSGQRFDELADQIEALRRRVAALEDRA